MTQCPSLHPGSQPWHSLLHSPSNASASISTTSPPSVTRAAVGIPTFVGSGLEPANLANYPHADGFIVGSSVKRDGYWANALDAARVKAVVDAFTALPAGR